MSHQHLVQQAQMVKEGKIIKLISNDYSVLADSKIYVCKSKGIFRYQKIKPVVGDNVLFNDEEKIIDQVLKRKNELVRPPISNVDQAFIITNVKPEFSSNLLDKLLVVTEFNNIKPIICFTKLDLLNEKELKDIEAIMNYYRKIGYTVIKNTETEEIKKLFSNKITVLTGQTGAGKSTLLNNIDKSLYIKTDEISKALGRGKHTTRHVELLNICNGFVADTPGFSDVSFIGMSSSDIRDNFIEFNEYKDKCKYRDCMHNKEDECLIKEKVKNEEVLKSRYENYINFISR